jgi:leucyl/phenylalanyl-tRNA--protein transferase
MSIVPWLNSTHEFPAIETALVEPDGLLAVGGDLSPERLVAAYRHGVFPWFDKDQPILWWSPNPRAVLFPDKIYISRSLNKRIKRQQFTITTDQCFESVIERCANVPRGDQNGTWITDEMQEAYIELSKRGIAHSVEVWEKERLVGGLYGLAIGKIFFGESMFSLSTDSSKVAFVYLAKQLHQWDFALVDCQVSNPHLLSLGAEEIDRSDFKKILTDNIDLQTNSDWHQPCIF